MKSLGLGKQEILDLARKKMTLRELNLWLVTPRPEWHGLHDATPHGLLESGCPSCLNEVLELIEAMPNGN